MSDELDDLDEDVLDVDTSEIKWVFVDTKKGWYCERCGEQLDMNNRMMKVTTLCNLMKAFAYSHKLCKLLQNTDS